MKNRESLIFFVSVLFFFLFTALFWSYSIDDAFVTYRYAENMVDGHGLTFNVGDPPVEGYSNFLWLLFLSLAYMIGLPVYMTAKVTGVLCFLLAGMIWYKNTAFDENKYLWLAPVLFMATPFTAFWAVSGLELGLYALILSLLAVGIVRRAWWFLALLPLLVMIRIEGFAIALVFIFAGWLGDALRKKIRWKFYIIGLIVTVAVFALLALFRMNIFGYPMPNTFYVKSILTYHGFLRLVKGLLYFAPMTLLFLYAIFNFVRNRADDRRFLVYTIVFLAMAVINCLADAVMNFHIRYLIAFWPFFLAAALTSMRYIDYKWIRTTAVAAMLILLFAPTYAVYSSVNLEKKIWSAQKGLIEYVNKQPEEIRISLTDVGRIPYYTKARYNDIWGLVSGDIGHDGFNALQEYLRFPDYFVFVGYFFGDNLRLTFGRERMISRNRGFNQAYRFIGAGLPEDGNLQDEGYYYLIFQKNRRAVDSLLNLYPIDNVAP